MASALTLRKRLEDLTGDEEGHTLSKSLSALSIMAIGIGGIIGAGIFVLTGTAAANYAGPGVMLSFTLAAVACAFVGLCYAELSALIPIAGSSYTYTYATLGEFFAWIIGWDLVLEYAMGAATVSVGWSGYLVSILRDVGIHLPPQFTNSLGSTVKLVDGSTVTGLFNLPAAMIVLLLTFMLARGTRESATVNNVMVAVKLAVVLGFIVIGAFYVDTSHWSPLVPENKGAFGEFGWSGVLRGAGVVFFAYIGFDAVSTAAQEARKPQTDMPIGILGSLAVCAVLYVLVAAVLTGLIPYTELNVPDPIAKGADAVGMGWFTWPIKIGAIAGLTTVMLVLLYGQSRIFYTMSKDGLLPPMFSKVHPKFGTPYLSQYLIGGCVALIGGLFPISLLGEMVSIGTLFAFILVCAAVMYLRRSEAEAHRPFRAPGVPVTPILGVLFCLALMVGLPLDTWIRLFVWMAIGLAIYFAYSRHHSVVQRRAGPAAGLTR
ncbi:amino acid permease [Chelatococcus sambhunathii]|uniref:Amino acid permease n=1 Tax=Chelatococcus sambhunathii TaxID=363953 RepID=A0ABU1DCS5_9HYPH|nr:amino acid permease [Chelatococcus sambhunathii]MDR4305720.1 amino acid permease [Chelatococcus sambhunathii]